MEWFGPSIWAFCIMFTWHTPWLWSGVLSHMIVFIFLDLFSFLFHLIFFSFFFFFLLFLQLHAWYRVHILCIFASVLLKRGRYGADSQLYDA